MITGGHPTIPVLLGILAPGLHDIHHRLGGAGTLGLFLLEIKEPTGNGLTPALLLAAVRGVGAGALV